MKWDLILLRRLAAVALILTTVLASIGCVAAGIWWLSLAFIAICIGWWLVVNHKQINVNDSIPFLFFLAAAAYAGFRGVGAGWLLLAGTGALIVWDLDHFIRPLTAVTLIVGEELMVKDHLQQLALVVGISLIVGTAAMLIQINLSYAIAFIFAFLAIWGLGLILGQVVDN